ncbi:MAG: OB-fold nucleic acid binding domain-containing protein, partial [Gammaproteobacteria bacterium]
AVRGVGEGPVEALVAARTQGGAFVDLHDFCQRVDARKANRRVVEALLRAGAFDDFAEPAEDLNTVRARLLQELPDALQSAEQTARNSALGMGDLFGGVEAARVAAPQRSTVTPLGLRERLEGERESLGLFLTGHPIESYLDELSGIGVPRIIDLRPRRGVQLIAGLVVSQRVLPSRRGGENCFVEIDDRSGRIEVSLFGDAFDQHRKKIAKGEILVFEGDVQVDEGGGMVKLRGERVYRMEDMRRRFRGSLRLDLGRLPAAERGAALTARLRRCLEPDRRPRTGNAVELVLQAGPHVGAEGRIRLGPEWQVDPTDALIERLRSEFGAGQVRLEYAGA